jgi:hypothetical protein
LTSTGIEITALSASPRVRELLSEVLVEAVASGGSVGFMHPLEPSERGRTLLVLDTATDGGASRLYERLEYALAGEIPDYALKPHGGLSGTLIYWKRIGAKR